MDEHLLERLLKIRDATVVQEGGTLKFKLVSFTDTSMSKDAIPGTPFRTFESVPLGRDSKRRQNDSMSFDPYVDTLFDYPLVVDAALGRAFNSVKELVWHLTIQVPYCGMDCWHCYNDKRVCFGGVDRLLEIQGDESPSQWSAQEILESFAECRRQGRSIGRAYNVLRVSGGEPFLVPELLAELLQLIHDNGQKSDAEKNQDYPVAIWTETNLITWAEAESEHDNRGFSDQANRGTEVV